MYIRPRDNSTASQREQEEDVSLHHLDVQVYH